MPGLKELTNFRANLQSLAHEEDVTSNWKEKYVQYPFPENPPIPDVDVDNLLDGIEMPKASDDLKEDSSVPDETLATGDEDVSFPSFDDIPGTKDNDLPAFDDIDLPPPETFSMPSDLDIGTFSYDGEDKGENILDDIESKPKKSSKKIDMEKWNAEPSKEDEERYVPSDDFLPPFDSSIEDNSNEMDFSTPNDEDLEDASSLSTEQLPLDSNNQIDDEFDISDLPEPSKSNDDFALPDFDPASFGLQDDDENVENLDVQDEGDAVPISEAETYPEESENKGDVQSLDDIPAFDLSEFDDDKLSRASDSSETMPISDDLSALEEADETNISDEILKNVEEKNLSNSNVVEDIEDAILPTEDAPLSDSGDDDVEDIEEAEPVDELEELPEESEPIPEADDSIGDFKVENIDEPLSTEDEGLEMLDEEPEIDLGAFDGDSSSENIPKPIDLYTEEDTDSSPSSSTVSKVDSAMPDEFNSFSNLDISQGGEESVIDEHSSFNLGDNPLEENISDTIGGGFSVPDDYAQFSQEKDSSYSSQDQKASAEENISLTITEDEYQHLIDRISSFPLNVRLEIENYLANNDDTTISKMEFVHLIVDGAKLKKIASKLSDILDKPIQIPKGFERRNAEEYEAEKQSFKWKLRHQIVPIATISSIILLLVSCISFLTWMFVYMPIVSETIYNRGYRLLSENKYDDAMLQFNKAGEYTKKKRWYFKYANGFREKKQFRQAEDVYRHLLYDFNHDKKGGLEYVSMLRDDLHNYEKAENVLRRQVLDYHVNDEQALISLGDTYLEWAGEKGEKYENARQTYSSLINMYGSKDIFLSRMMKYFIRTDKLNEVLPLKEHFINNLKKLDIDDLTELGSYLVKKRYEDEKAGEDAVSEGIDDVREILETALKRDKDNPTATYNMGKFFLYNRNFDVAKRYLSRSVDMYGSSNNLSSTSLMNNVDAMRLYGEILTKDKEYLMAQETYANALSKYKEYAQNKLLAPNHSIGKLYQDYGDVNYFISGDLDKALDAYSMATKEMNDTPSIRYRMGYIQYQKANYEDAMHSLLLVHGQKQKDKNLLYSLGNTLYKRGSYDVAQGYYERLMEILEAERIRKDVLFPHTREDHNAFIEEYMRSTNNLAVILNKLAMQNGNSEKNGRALFLFGESSRAWDALTRNPQTLIPSKAVSLSYLNTRNIINPKATFEAEIYSDIPKTLEGERILQKEVDR